MKQRRRNTTWAAVTAFCLAASVGLTDAAGPLTAINNGGLSSQPARASWYAVDAVNVFQTGEMTAPVRDAILAAAADVGAPAAPGRGFTLGLTRVRRGSTVIQQATGSGWAFPMGITALPIEAVTGVMGRDVARPLLAGQIVMGATSAGLRGAQVGDTIDLMAANGTIRTLTIGLIAPDAQVGGTEIVMSIGTADLLGATITTRVLVWAPRDRNALSDRITARLNALGSTTAGKVRIRRSWDPSDPDSNFSLVQTKASLGEFDIYYAGISTNGFTAINSGWVAANLPSGRETYPTGIRARCHVDVKAALTAALQEVVNTYPSLVYYGSNDVAVVTGINVANTNTYGGCATGQARFARITQNLGSISRHSWGQPIDISTNSNCQGCVPKMDCRIVRIFRKHGFAWGGNFLTPDGMHFEWVGEARHTWSYPSKYCPNLSGGRIQTVTPPIERDTFFAEDGLSNEHVHDH